MSAGTFEIFDALIRARAEALVAELKDLVRLPTVSAQRSGIDETVTAVLERARRAGVDASALRVEGGPPTIVGSAGSGARTLLVYDHYDVQPPDPLDEWETPPFEPTERGGYLFARGVSDNKDNLLARLQALERHLDRRGFTDIEVEPAHGELPSRWPADTEVAKAAVAALRAAYGTDPVVYPLMVGSGPMAQVCDALGIPVVGSGSRHAGSANHAPNENIRIADYLDHIRAFGRFPHAFAGRTL